MKDRCVICGKTKKLGVDNCCAKCQQKVDKWTKDTLGLVPDYDKSFIRYGLKWIPMKKVE